MENENKLPSQFQINDMVECYGLAQKAKVVGVHFTESKVRYDLEVHYEYLDKDDFTVFTGVDSAMLMPYENREEVPVNSKIDDSKIADNEETNWHM